MFASVGPSLASLRSSLAGLTLPSSQQKKKKKEIDAIAQDLKDAERNWNWIQAVLADAEERQIDNRLVREWLHDLRDLVYQIEDLRDEYEYEVVAREVQASKKAPSSSGDAGTSTGRKVEVRPSSLSPLLDDSFRDDLGRIKKEFDAIAKRREALHLKEADGPKHSPTDGISRREATGHLAVAPVCHGRDGNRQQLRDLLIADHGDGHFEVIAVLGMGGMGKTTLAQYVLKERQVKEYFDKIVWVHVSETYDVIRLTNAVIESFSGSKSDLSGLSPLQDKITELIKDKKVLLVADDVWNTENISWETFVTPFRDGAKKGSKILVTTRLAEVINGTKAAKHIELKGLSEGHGWSLLKEHAFQNQKDGVDNAEELEKIGKRIVAKCRGLPLSIKLLGSLLSYKENDEKEWRDVMESNLLDLSEGSDAKKKILGSLHLSYQHLSPKLQSCFKCCSKYPKDRIEAKHLKHSWIAYDLVKDEKEASRCLYELQSRSFLELNIRRINQQVRMHDHIYDLAQYAQGEEHLNIQYKGVPVPEEVGRTHFSGARHVAIAFHNSLHVYYNSCCHINTTQANVRTLALSWFPTVRMQLSLGRYLRELDIVTSYVEFTSCDDGYQNQLKCLRLLSLQGEWSSIPVWVFQLYNLRYLSVKSQDLQCLSDSVCDLRNLRGLSIQGSRITFVPEAISRLTNLQYLDLKDSPKIKDLPKTISELVNLQELNLDGCVYIKGLPEWITYLTKLRTLNLGKTKFYLMPKGIGALTELKYLRYYVPDSTEGAGLAELKNMRYLEDLTIRGLRYIVNEEDASQAELDKKKHLRKLILSWDYEILSAFLFLFLKYNPSPFLRKEERIATDHEEQRIATDHEEQVLKKIRPHPNLEELVIYHYRGFKLPSWMGDESFTKLVTLLLCQFDYCTSLSPIDQLPSLKYLFLERMDSLNAVVPEHNGGHDADSDSMGSATEPRVSFPKLKFLNIGICKSIELLPLRKLASLEHVRVHNCGNLERMEPPYHSPCPLRQITIRDCLKFHFSPDPRFPKPSWELVVKKDYMFGEDDDDTYDSVATLRSPHSDI